MPWQIRGRSSQEEKVILKQRNDIGFRENLRKSFFMQKEVEYLKFLLTSDGVNPQPMKVNTMNRIKPPTNSKQLKQVSWND